MPGSPSNEYTLSEIFNLKGERGIWDDIIKDKSISVTVNGNVTSTGIFQDLRPSSELPDDSYVL